MKLDSLNKAIEIIDKHITIKCPHCSLPTGLSAVSIPNYSLLCRYRPLRIHIGYRCNACGEPVSLCHSVSTYNDKAPLNYIEISSLYAEILQATETFELNYLPTNVAQDFEEALKCYSSNCLNAFAAMCRRTLQSAAAELGAEGNSKVQKQLNELKSIGMIDDDAFNQLKQIMLDGHDGTHPHLPKLNTDRASILLELTKDVLYQIFVRKAKIEEAARLRQNAINA